MIQGAPWWVIPVALVVLLGSIWILIEEFLKK